MHSNEFISESILPLSIVCLQIVICNLVSAFVYTRYTVLYKVDTLRLYTVMALNSSRHLIVYLARETHFVRDTLIERKLWRYSEDTQKIL